MANLNFTARGIAALKVPESGRVEYWDDGMPGFGIRISSSGIKTWVVMYRHLGRKRRHTLGNYPAMTLANAYEKARVSLNDAANGRDPAAEKISARRADTFGELADEYLLRHAIKKKSKAYDKQMLDSDLLPRWKNLKAKEITRRDVLNLLDDIVERGAPIKANRILALVRKIFNFGISRDIVEHNPCAAVPLPAKPRSKDRSLTAEEIRKVWQAAEEDESLVAAMLKLRLITAQRGGEVVAMEWSEIDFESAIWTIPAAKSKNGLAHRVPLSALALEVLKPLADARGTSRWVFPSRLSREKPDSHIENVQKAIQRIRSRKGLEVNFSGHDLRRTAATHMASLGVPRLVISKILNHVESGVTAVYDRHSYDMEKREALELWARNLSGIIAGRGSSTVIGLSTYASSQFESKVLRG